MADAPSRRWLMPAVLLGAGIFLLSGLYRCPLHALTGLPCPGCGLTRATWLLVRGEPRAATSMHPLVWAVLPFVVVLIGSELAGYLRAGAWGASARIPGLRRIGGLIVAAMFALWLARFAGAFGGPVP